MRRELATAPEQDCEMRGGSFAKALSASIDAAPAFVIREQQSSTTRATNIKQTWLSTAREPPSAALRCRPT